MKEIKRTRTIEEVTGYEANDGTIFTTKEECKKYEESAECAVRAMFDSICVKNMHHDKTFAECELWERYGYGGEDFKYVIADIKTEDELKIANMFCKMWASQYGKPLGIDYIGKRVLIAIGDNYDHSFYPCGTEHEMVEDFKKLMAAFFHDDMEKKGA